MVRLGLSTSERGELWDIDQQLLVAYKMYLWFLIRCSQYLDGKTLLEMTEFKQVVFVNPIYAKGIYVGQ